MLARQAVKLKQKVIGKQNADGVSSAKGKNEKCAFVESVSRRLQQRENDVNNPFACTQNVRKTVVLPTAENNVNGKQRIKRKSVVQKRRSSTPPFLLMLFYKPFCRANICKTDVFDFFINQRFERNFLPFAVNQRLKIYVFGVGYKSTFWKLASSAFFVRVATQFSWQTFFVEGLSFKTCSPTCLQCNFCVKVVFLR